MMISSGTNSRISGQFQFESVRLKTFDSLSQFNKTTLVQLAIAGFIYEGTYCLCAHCQVKLALHEIDQNCDYPDNHFRILHRKRSLNRNQLCPFLFCQDGTNQRDLPQSSEREENYLDAEYPELGSYRKRLETFQSPSTIPSVTQEKLAESGFFYTGSHDAVQCFYCGNSLMNWSTTELSCSQEYLTFVEHARFFPCAFIERCRGRKFVADALHSYPVSGQERLCRTLIQTTEMMIRTPHSFDECLETFELWPDDSPVSALDLANAGFYYLGTGLKVKCHVCGIEMERWSFGVSLIAIHRERNSECQFIRTIDYTTTGNVKCVDEQWRLDTLKNYPLPSRSKDLGPADDLRLIQELAASGFYWSQQNHRLSCVYCGVTINPVRNQSIMSQHRAAAKRFKPPHSIIDCPMVRAVCIVNIPIASRKPFPEYPRFRSIFHRKKTFEDFKLKKSIQNSGSIEERIEGGFFMESATDMRCFQCGNHLPIPLKRLLTKYPDFNVAKLHAYFHPTCEWIQQYVGPKFTNQVIFERRTSMSMNFRSSARLQNFSGKSSISSSSSRSSIPSENEDLIYMSDFTEDSDDDDDYKPVLSPIETLFTQIPLSPIPTRTDTEPSVSDDSETIRGQPSVDLILGQPQSPPNIVSDLRNPFGPIETNPTETPLMLRETVTTAVNTTSYFAVELNRLQSFTENSRHTFAGISVDEWAYVGFFFNADDDSMTSFCCNIKLSEARVIDVRKRKPTISDCPLSKEEWTPMRIHQHEIGQGINGEVRPCLFARRQQGKRYPNVMLASSRMRFPEYPTYAKIETRVKSFQADWPYPDGTKLSKLLMADAGFIHLGGNRVCCFYCGNRIKNFEPQDCPYEEHATIHPLCDYIIYQRGWPFVEKLANQNSHDLSGKWKLVQIGNDLVQIVLFPRTSYSEQKAARFPVRRIKSVPNEATSIESVICVDNTKTDELDHLETSSNMCIICRLRVACMAYIPCEHTLICSECYESLRELDKKKCMRCRCDAEMINCATF